MKTQLIQLEDIDKITFPNDTEKLKLIVKMLADEVNELMLRVQDLEDRLA